MNICELNFDLHEQLDQCIREANYAGEFRGRPSFFVGDGTQQLLFPSCQALGKVNPLVTLASPQGFWKSPGGPSEQDNDTEAATVVIVGPPGCSKPSTSPKHSSTTVPVVHSRLGSNLFLHHGRPSSVPCLAPNETPRDCGEVYMSPAEEEEGKYPRARWSRMCSRYLMSAKERSRRKSGHTPSPTEDREESGGEELSSSNCLHRAKGRGLGRGNCTDSSDSDGENSPAAELYSSTPSPEALESDGGTTAGPSLDRHGALPRSEASSSRCHQAVQRSSHLRMNVGPSIRRKILERKLEVSPSPPREQGTPVKQVPIKPCTVVVQRESGKTVAEQLKRLQEVKGSPMREVRSSCTPLSSASSTPSKVSLSVLAGDVVKVPEVIAPQHHRGRGKHDMSDGSDDTHCEGVEECEVPSPTTSVATTPKADHNQVSTQEGSATGSKKKSLSLRKDASSKRVLVKEVPSGSHETTYTRMFLVCYVECDCDVCLGVCVQVCIACMLAIG